MPAMKLDKGTILKPSKYAHGEHALSALYAVHTENGDNHHVRLCGIAMDPSTLGMHETR